MDPNVQLGFGQIVLGFFFGVLKVIAPIVFVFFCMFFVCYLVYRVLQVVAIEAVNVAVTKIRSWFDALKKKLDVKNSQ